VSIWYCNNNNNNNVIKIIIIIINKTSSNSSTTYQINSTCFILTSFFSWNFELVSCNGFWVVLCSLDFVPFWYFSCCRSFSLTIQQFLCWILPSSPKCKRAELILSYEWKGSLLIILLIKSELQNQPNYFQWNSFLYYFKFSLYLMSTKSKISSPPDLSPPLHSFPSRLKSLEVI